MKLIVNGEERDADGVATLADLLARMNTGSARVATVVNDDIVPSDRRAGHVLKDGDRVEIVGFAGGG